MRCCAYPAQIESFGYDDHGDRIDRNQDDSVDERRSWRQLRYSDSRVIMPESDQ